MTEKIRKVKNNLVDLQNNAYFKGSELSMSMAGGSHRNHQNNQFFQAVNDAGNATVDLFTEDERKEGG